MKSKFQMVDYNLGYKDINKPSFIKTIARHFNADRSWWSQAYKERKEKKSSL